jgi:TP901 family phage tail tape measure protein
VALRTVGVRLTAEIGEYQSKLRAAAQTTRDFKGELDKAGKKGGLDRVADTAGIVGLGLVGMAGAAIKSAADFDKAMSAVSAATHAPKGELDQLRAAALQAGKDTQYSATQAADGITELSKAGVKTADILGGGLKGALSLAAAGQLSVGEAAETAASAMTQFKLSGDQVPHVADLLAAAAGKAQGSVHDMGAALNQSGLVAAQFGLSIEDTTGVLGEFASAGLMGSDAGTSLKTMLLAIANPSKQTRVLMDQLGISFYDASGKFIGMSGVAEVLQQRLHGLTDAQRQQALGQIFGNDAIRSASILYSDGAAGVQKWKNAVNDSGYAASTASKLTDNLAGDVERLRGSLETVFIEAGSGANGGLRVLAKTLNQIVDQIGNMSPATTGAIVVIGGLTGVLLVGGAAWLKYKKFIAEAQEQMIATGPAGEKAAAGLGKVTSALGKVAGWAAAAEAAGLLFSNLDTKSTDVDRLTSSLQNFISTGQTAGQMKDIFGDNFDKLGRIAEFADGANHGFGKFVLKVSDSIPIFGDAGKQIGEFGSRLIAGTDFDTAKAQMADLDTALTNNITSIHDYNKASQLWQQVLLKSGLNTEQLAELLPNTYKELQKQWAASEQASGSLNKYSGSAKAASGKLGDLNSALAVGADAQDKYATEADAVAGAARGERAALSALHSMLKAETDPVFALIDAQQKLKTAQDAYTKAVKEHGKNSKEAKAADLDSAKAALNLQDAVGGLAGTFNGKMDPAFVKTLRAAGLTEAQIKDVGKQFVDAKKKGDDFSHEYKGKTSAPGAKQAKIDIDNAYTAGKQYDGTYIARLKIDGVHEVDSKLDALLVKQRALQTGLSVGAARAAVQKDLDRNRQRAYADGGWTGPGDTYQPAGIVHADEYVLKKSARSSLEDAKPGALDYMNQTGQWPGYARGGIVWPFRDYVGKTKIPELKFNAPGGGSGPGYKWMEAAVRAAFPGMPVYSDYRPGAITITGNRSYHGFGRAVDFAPSKPLAEWINLHFMARTKELITPWQSLNIQNGHRHAYSALVENQHNFAGGNAHDHWAMANGGMITEPVFGVGASGRTYSFGENYQPERVTPMWQTGGHGGGGDIHIHATFSGPVGSQYELENWFVGVHDRLRNRGRV